MNPKKRGGGGKSVTIVTINGGNFTNGVGETGTLTVAVLPINHTNGSVTWFSSSHSVSIDSNTGAYEAVSIGTSIISAIIANLTNTITITVQQIQGIQINSSVSIKLVVGEEQQATATVTAKLEASTNVT